MHRQLKQVIFTLDCAPSIQMYLKLVALLISCCPKEGHSNLAFVCTGDAFTHACSTYGVTIQWNITIPSSTADLSASYTSHTILVLKSHAIPFPPEFFVTNLRFIFSIPSNTTSLLTSAMFIENVTNILNGTIIQCTTQEGTVLIPFIYVIKTGIPHSSIMFTNKEYNTENITVIIKRSEEQHTTYNITLSTSTTYTSLNFTNSSRLQLTLLYNIEYTVNFLASRCQQTFTNTTYLHYIKCDYPSQKSSTALITGYSDPALVGTNITISCPSGDKETENETMVLTCMDDGEWQPNPRDIRCSNTHQYTESDVSHTSTLAGSHDKNTTQAILSKNELVVVAFSVLFYGGVLFIFGVLCDCLCKKCFPKVVNKLQTPDSTQNPSTLEMTENVAYGSVRRPRTGVM